MSDGFLGRWSRRKLDANAGRPPADEPPAPAPAIEPPAPGTAAAAVPALAPRTDGASPAPIEAQAAPAPPPPTLEDVQQLTIHSDFSRFAARDVAPEVKNAALRKLFADPRYNVMDGLDVYIDDYSQAQPLPASALRQLAGAAFLRLFEEPAADGAPPPTAAEPQARDVADNPTARSVAQSDSVSDRACEPPEHADPDLRLQQDDAAAAGGAGPGPA